MKRVLLLFISSFFTVIISGGYLSAQTEQVVINEVLSLNTNWNYDKDFGAFSDWIELYNPTDHDIDLEGWSLSDNPGSPGKWKIPAHTIIPKNGYLLFWADGKDLRPGETAYVLFTEIKEITVAEYHLNFRINRTLEELGLYDPDLILRDRIVLADQEPNYSFGREISDPDSWAFLAEPTPNEKNSQYSSKTFVTSPTPEFSLGGGLYSGSKTLTLQTVPPGIIVKYTTDGTEPTSNSKTYTEPVPIHFSQVIKARAFESGKLPGSVVSESYIIDKTTDLPVLSISTDHQNLWGFDFGLYQNNYKNREIFAHLEYFEENGNKAFDINAGLQLFGSQIFLFDQKPFSIYFRGRYGKDSLNYRLFENKDISSFRSLVLRNGGNDNNLTMFRDGLGAAIIEDQVDIDYQSYKPVVVYMNGEYWGIFNLREKINEGYLHENHKANPDYIDILEDSMTVNNGDANNYSEIIDFITVNDISLDDNYNYISQKIDVNEYINYMSYKIYGAYKQWQVNNKYWREREKGSVWRWIAFDLEHCFAGPGGDNYEVNSFLSLLEPGSAEWSTVMFRKLMENDRFRSAFIQRTSLFLNTLFQEKRVLHLVDSLQNNISDEMDEHIKHWNSPVSKSVWLQNINLLKDFTRNRNQYMYTYMMSYFNIPDTSRLTIKSTEGGRILVCSSYILKGDSATFTMFDSIPFSLVAMPEPGYRFTGWNNARSDRNIELVLRNDTVINASFEKSSRFSVPSAISNTLVLDDNSQPWIANGNIIIPEGDSLIINEGVKLLMTPNSSLVNYGFLSINGTEEDPVTIDINSNITDSYYKTGKKKWGGIIIESKDTTRIVNAILENASSGFGYGNYKGSINANNSKIVLKGVHISGVLNPVYCYNSDVVIESCKLSSRGTGDLINLKNCKEPVIVSCDLKGNYYKDSDAIDLDGVTGALVDNNLIYSFFGINSDGIDLGENSSDIVIRNNTIVSCSDKGISVGQGSKIVARNNIIVDCNQGFGIKDFNSFASINQNTLYANRVGIACFEKNTGNGGGTAVVENTIIANSINRSIYVDELSLLEISYSISDRDSLPGNNNMTGDPMFVSEGHQNFFLQAGSPCINSGDPGQYDPDGTRADRGAFISEPVSTEDRVIINEVNFNAFERKNSGDWLELYNPGKLPVNMSNWILKGGVNSDEFVFRDNLVLQAGEFMIIAENKDSLQKCYQQRINAEGNFAFGLSREGELIRVYNEDYKLIHSLEYCTDYPWLDGANGKGATLELYNGETDNSQYENWHASYVPGGTPGETNSETAAVKGIYINELMAKNENAFPDEYGEFDDWIELYNSNQYEIDLAGMNFIIGETGQQMRMIPFYCEQSTVIEPFGYKLFWADKDPEQGELHMDFNLSAYGGSIGIGQHIDKQIHYTDKVSFGPQDTDLAYGRYPDGNDLLTILKLSPGFSNILLSRKTSFIPGIKLYPNPADDYFIIEHPDQESCTTGYIYSVNGQVIKTFELIPEGRTRIPIRNIPPGIYMIHIQGSSFKQKVVIY